MDSRRSENTAEKCGISDDDGGESEASEADEAGWPLIVVTGGSGFIGSHTVLEILQEGK